MWFNKYILFGFLFCVVGVSICSAQDSLVCFPKKDAITLANKIRLIQDSLSYKDAIIRVQDTTIVLYENRVNLYEEQIKNREKTIDIYKEQTDIMTKTIQDLQPKWYDNKFLWFTGGVISTVTAILLIK